jgi:predicted DsbA family dithiol-disulfide isomerase
MPEPFGSSAARTVCSRAGEQAPTVRRRQRRSSGASRDARRLLGTPGEALILVPASKDAEAMKIDVWSDVVCPWCWIGERRLSAALARFEHRDDVEVRFHSFELDPQTPRNLDAKTTEHLAKKYGLGPAQLASMLERVRGLGRAEGLDMKLEETRTANTFDAHRLIHLAAAKGKQRAMVDRLFHAYFTDCARLGDAALLVRSAVAIGLDEAEANDTLASDRFSDDVRADEAQARSLGINGVPFYLVDGAVGVSGAQSADVLLDVLGKVWAKNPTPRTQRATAAGDVCDPSDPGSCVA